MVGKIIPNSVVSPVVRVVGHPITDTTLVVFNSVVYAVAIDLEYPGKLLYNEFQHKNTWENLNLSSSERFIKIDDLFKNPVGDKFFMGITNDSIQLFKFTTNFEGGKRIGPSIKFRTL